MFQFNITRVIKTSVVKYGLDRHNEDSLLCILDVTSAGICIGTEKDKIVSVGHLHGDNAQPYSIASWNLALAYLKVYGKLTTAQLQKQHCWA